ncbi:MAG: hypothetical protein ACLPV8_26895 [Steroidobacteraceae bacterium]
MKNPESEHRTCKRSNEREGNEKRRRLRTCQAPQHLKVKRRAVSAGASAVCHRVQWNAFVKKIGEHDLTDAFVKVVEKIETFATPLLHSIAHGETLSRQWKAGHGWAG